MQKPRTMRCSVRSDHSGSRGLTSSWVCSGSSWGSLLIVTPRAFPHGKDLEGMSDALSGPRVVDCCAKLTGDTDPAVTYQDWIADDTFDVMSRVKDICVPALVISGAGVRLTPVKYHQFLAAQIPGCRLTVVEKAALPLGGDPRPFAFLIGDEV